MCRKGDHLELRQVGGLDLGLVCRLAEIEHLGRICLQRKCHRFQFERRVRKSRKLRELDAVDTLELRRVAPFQWPSTRDVGCVNCFQGDFFRDELAFLFLAEYRISKTNQFLTRRGAGRQPAQGRKRGDGRHHRDRVGAGQPRDLPIAGKQRVVLEVDLRWGRGQQGQR